MSLSRWKMMAGVLGVSIGGLAAAASQCPKLDKSKGRQTEAPLTAEAPKVAPAGAPSAPTPPAMPVSSSPAMPPVMPLPTPSAELPKPATAPGGLPAIPDLTPPAPMKPVDVTPTAGTLPALPGLPEPSAKPDTSKPLPIPSKPMEAAKITPPAPTADLLPPPPTKPTAPVSAPPAPPAFDFGPPPSGKPPVATPPVVGAGGTQLPPAPPAGNTVPPPPIGMGTSAVPPIETPPMQLDIPVGKPPVVPVTVTQPATVAATKFRILLRVGEGEPTFEVKCGDDLVLKVACEKVDIKSPEKGSGLSAVTAKGKVRFAGFGVEGTCDELSFMAGTGEVSMSGEVKVQVKDKLGRVESELTTATLKYKIDASAVGGSIKP